MSDPLRDGLDAVLETWVAGWGRSRSMPVTREGRAWRAEVDDEYRSTEWVIADPSGPELDHLAARARVTPKSWVTVIGHGVVPGLTPIARGERMMRTTLSHGDAEGVAIEERAGVAFATVTLDGVVAARGQAAVAGAAVVVDKIVTETPFRRRGLGRAVMVALTGWALTRGATDGLLIASEDGVLLYSSLGWESVTPIVTFG
jgi:GNAT superfamily N-acetyltransferase